MKRALVILGTFLTLGLLGLVYSGTRCILRGHHRPERKQGAAGFRCLDCPVTGHDLDAMGEDVALQATRRTYERQHGSLTRSSWDEPLAATERPGRDRRFRRGRVLPLDERARRAEGA